MILTITVKPVFLCCQLNFLKNTAVCTAILLHAIGHAIIICHSSGNSTGPYLHITTTWLMASVVHHSTTFLPSHWTVKISRTSIHVQLRLTDNFRKIADTIPARTSSGHPPTFDIISEQWAAFTVHDSCKINQFSHFKLRPDKLKSCGFAAFWFRF